MTEARTTRRASGAALRWALLGFALLFGLGAAILFALPSQEEPLITQEAAAALPCLESPGAYTVELSPAGEVCFRRPPERVITLDAHYNDMLVMIDREQRLIATGYEGNSTDVFYAQLPGLQVDVDLAKLPYIGGTLDKETLYAQRADVHHIDPERLILGNRWSRADVEEIARNVGPFFANRYSRENSYPGDAPYTYYTAWELAGRISAVYQRPQPAAALQQVWEAMVRDLQARLPPEAERPTVGVLIPNKTGFTPFSLTREGFGTAHYRAVGARDAFEPIRHLTYADAGRGATLDVEGLLALDPDIIIMPFAIYPSYKERYKVLTDLINDPLAGRLKAIRAGRVYPGGTPLQGPLFLLFQTEMVAKQVYPDLFGPYRPDHAYPPAEQLFDRALVARLLADPGAP